VMRIPPDPTCATTACACLGCTCLANQCFDLPGCRDIVQCAFKVGCRDSSCVLNQACQPIIDKLGGTNGPAYVLAGLFLGCVSSRGCGACGTVDAGLGCQVTPPPMAGLSCSAQFGPDCTLQCTDIGKNTYLAKCSANACTCFYNGQPTCSCFNGTGDSGSGLCGSCCPGFPQ
jgi:hypothetical protein